MASNDELKRLHEEFQAQIKAQAAQIKRPTILVCGYLGTGKTSLIKGICGPEIVPEHAVKHGARGTTDYTPYENEFVRFWDSMGLEPGEKEEGFVARTHAFVRERQSDPNVDNHIHLVWYCIQGSGARVTETDKRLIKDIFSNVIVLITKNDITRENQRQALQHELEKAGVRKDRLLFCSETDPDSLRAIVQLSKELLPEAFRDAWLSAQLVDLDAKKAKAQAIIHTAAASAAAAGGLNPLPGDALLITPIQTGMVVSLAYLYGFPAEAIKGLMLPAIAEAAGVLTVGGLLKAFPGLGGVIEATIAGALTEVIGQLANTYLVKTCEARLHGKPMPAFALAFDTIGEKVWQAIRMKKKA